MKRNYKLLIAYDGTRYNGWESQTTTDMTIEGKLEAVLSRMMGCEVDVIGAGRTDAGVHAKEMAANVHLDTALSCDQILDVMNRYLPEDIAVKEVREASDRFHARYNATGKTYSYTCYYGRTKPVFDRKYVYVLDQNPDLEKMKKAAAQLTGIHDYMSFCGNSKMKKSTIREVDRIDIVRKGPYITFYYHGTGFLQNMVRIMTGTLLEVGYGRIRCDAMGEILDAKNRQAAGFTAPAQGLSLVKVDYN